MTTDERVGAFLGAGGITMVGGSVAAASLLTGYPILGGQAVRYGIASMLLFGWARMRRQPIVWPTRREYLWLAGVALTGMAGFNVLLIEATARSDPSIVGIIVGTAPIGLAIVGAWQVGRRPTPGVVAGAIVVVAGASLVQGASGEASVTGLVLALAAMLGEVCFSLLAVPVLARIGALSLSAHATWIAALMLATSALALDGRGALAMPSGTELGALAFMALMVTAVAFVCWYTAVDRLGADRTGLLAGLIPVSALFASTLVGTDQITLVKLIGVLLVAGGIVAGVRARVEARAREPGARGARRARGTRAQGARRAAHRNSETTP